MTDCRQPTLKGHPSSGVQVATESAVCMSQLGTHDHHNYYTILPQLQIPTLCISTTAMSKLLQCIMDITPLSLLLTQPLPM